jgi:ubiquinone/menaquinone biosynthesis C-methylase UbiE
MSCRVALCRTVNWVFSVFPVSLLIRPPNLGKRGTPEEYPEWEFSQAMRSLAFFSPYNTIDGKRILDIGCGHGGKSIYYALNGAVSVDGIDINADKIGVAVKFAKKKQVQNISFQVGDASSMQYESQSFDMILFNDSFEHLSNPEKVILECQRVLKPGGVINIIFPPFNSPWGAHLFAYIRIPWAQFVFAEKTLLQSWKEYEKLSNVGTVTYSKDRIRSIAKMETIAELMHLNKMSIRQFEEIIAKTNLQLSLWKLKTVGNLFDSLGRRDWAREFVVSRVVAVLKG